MASCWYSAGSMPYAVPKCQISLTRVYALCVCFSSYLYHYHYFIEKRKAHRHKRPKCLCATSVFCHAFLYAKCFNGTPRHEPMLFDTCRSLCLLSYRSSGMPKEVVLTLHPQGEVKSLRLFALKTGLGSRANFRRISKGGYLKMLKLLTVLPFEPICFAKSFRFYQRKTAKYWLFHRSVIE